MNTALKTFTSVVAIFIPFSCGGGHSSSGSDDLTTIDKFEASAQPTTIETPLPQSTQLALEFISPTSVDTPQIAETPISQQQLQTKELMSEKGFIFSSSGVLNLSITVESNTSSPDRVTLCHVNEKKYFKTSECLYSGSLSGTRFVKQFSVPNHVDDLVLVFWYFDEVPRRSLFTWNRNQGEFWNVAL